jgi:hypothetical protein
MPRCSLREGGWESRCVDRTGKLDLRCRRLDQGSALGIERDGGDWRPVSGLPAPASWVAFPRLLIDRVAGLEQRPILAGMTLRRGDVADGAMAVLVAVPLHKTNRPLPCGVKVGQPFGRELRPILRGAKQRLGKGVILAHPRPRVRRLDAEPVQHGRHRRCLQGGAVVAMQDRACRHRMDALGQGRACGQVRRVVDTTSIAELSGGNSRATIRSLYRCPYRATSVFLRPQRFRSYPGGNSCDTGGRRTGTTVTVAQFRTELGEGVRHRTNRYLNNRIEQDHRGIKGRYQPMRGFPNRNQMFPPITADCTSSLLLSRRSAS